MPVSIVVDEITEGVELRRDATVTQIYSATLYHRR